MITRIAVCVCTANRPQMLARCLTSLAAQEVRDDLALHIVVIDNEAQPNNRAIAERTPSNWQVHYRHEPRRGIAFARNAALHAAHQLGAEWIVMVDDDQQAERNLVDQLMHPEYENVPVLMGHNVYTYPDPLPPWVFEKKKVFEEGKQRKTSGCGNVRFTIRLYHAGLRFDETLGDQGGEDTKFFSQAYAIGAEIRQTARAITREAAHPERLTFCGQVYRQYWQAAANAQDEGLLIAAGKAVFGLVDGLLHLVLALPLWPLDRVRWRKWTLRGGKRLAKAAGRLAALTGRMPKPYAQIVGL